MSLVYLRNSSNSAWVPISADAGAIPNKVNGLTQSLAFKSICGVASPTTPRYIRDQSNSNWIPLDETSTLPFVRSVDFYFNSSARSITMPMPTDVVWGDLIVAWMTTQNTGTASACAMTATTGWERRTRSNVNYLGANSAAFWDKKDGNTSNSITITVSSSVNAGVAGMIMAIGNVSGTTWNTVLPEISWTTSPQASRTFLTKTSLSTTADPTLALNLFASTRGMGVPYSLRAGNFGLFDEGNINNSGQPDLGVAVQNLNSGGASGVTNWNFGDSGIASSYASLILMVKP